MSAPASPSAVEVFASGFLMSLSLCLDLGLVNVTILRTALRSGPRPALWVGLGSCLGDLTYFVLSALGVTALLTWGPVRWALWLGGTAVLLFLAARMIREVVRPHAIDLNAAGADVEALAAAPSRRRSFSLGLVMALSSPTAILWFVAVGGNVIAASAGRRGALVPFVAGFFAAGLTWSIAAAYGAAALGRLGGPRLVRALSALSAVLFLFLAVVVFRDGLRSLP
jgi:L-lysine exporter family protein LysE/ArgO